MQAFLDGYVGLVFSCLAGRKGVGFQSGNGRAFVPALEAGLPPFFCLDIPCPDLPDIFFLTANFIFKYRYAAANVVELMGIAAARTW